ncbi:TLC domain-domain-containing protein [Protomyces lactucae-debilis]|uniref:TLC domain-domain-containing protein n=1 Tax=Protomyces lactucae-debilis TaxID=2754530 RepID=A0A1Y2EXS6_PROLT|nr:TLC domain-containing protein [Protomyces lactucae-debilis]ORY76034.1 TLC domain-domain-containing protein [Protomyces lactucae-debilis]
MSSTNGSLRSERPGINRVRSRSASVNKIPTSQPGRFPRSPRAPPTTTLGVWQAYARDNTWFVPMLIILAAIGLYLMDPTERNPAKPFLFVSYPVEGTSPRLYGKGKADALFISFYVVVFTFTREFCMQWILAPLARSLGLKRGKVQRFMEQGYTIMYFTASASYGIYVMSHTSMWYFNTHEFYAGYPHILHKANFKIYYLCQFAYWLQQFIVLALQLEKPRKDFHELVAHHVVTLLLIGLSWKFHFTWIGLAVFITMDSSDIWLALSKNFNYIDSPLTAPVFATFIGVWFYTRLYLSAIILWSVLTEFETVGPWEIDWEKEHYKCWISQYVTFGLLFMILLLNIYWSFLIARIAYRFILSNEAKDERSDDEDEAEQEAPVQKKRQ